MREGVRQCPLHALNISIPLEILINLVFMEAPYMCRPAPPPGHMTHWLKMWPVWCLLVHVLVGDAPLNDTKEIFR